MGKTQRKNRKKVIITTVIITGVVLFGLWLIGRYQVGQDADKFMAFKGRKDTVATSLSDYLGDNVKSVRSKDICFNTEQRPYDDGKLWCQVATVISLKSDVDYDQVGKKFVEIATAVGLQTNESSGGNKVIYSFSVENERWCEFGYLALSGDGLSAGTRDVLVDEGAPAIALACADRAKAVHYPFEG